MLVRHKITGTIPERGGERIREGEREEEGREMLPAVCSLFGTRVRHGNNGVTELRP